PPLRRQQPEPGADGQLRLGRRRAPGGPRLPTLAAGGDAASPPRGGPEPAPEGDPEREVQPRPPLLRGAGRLRPVGGPAPGRRDRGRGRRGGRVALLLELD